MHHNESIMQAVKPTSSSMTFLKNTQTTNNEMQQSISGLTQRTT